MAHKETIANPGTPPLPLELILSRFECVQPCAVKEFAADELELFEERAAIMEFDGKRSRAEAERRARQELQSPVGSDFN
jgi:hypothetical protein